MNLSKAIFLISDEARAVMATYERGDNAKRKMFKTLDPAIAVDDYVVVPTDTRHHMTVNKIVEVDVDVDFDTPEEVPWIDGRVHRADFEDLQRQEAQASAMISSAEKRKKREELRESLEAAAGKELKSLPIYTANKT